jgi:hypothetical protein
MSLPEIFKEFLEFLKISKIVENIENFLSPYGNFSMKYEIT